MSIVLSTTRHLAFIRQGILDELKKSFSGDADMMEFIGDQQLVKEEGIMTGKVNQKKDPILEFEEIIHNYKDIGGTNWWVFKKNFWNGTPITISAIIYLAAGMAWLGIFNRLTVKIGLIVPDIWWLWFSIMFGALGGIVLWQRRNLRREMELHKVKYRGAKVVYLRDRTFFDDTHKQFEIPQYQNLKKYIALKINELKRQSALPKIISLGVLGAVGYSIMDNYFKKIDANEILSIGKIFIIVAAFVLGMELMLQNMRLFFDRKYRYSQLLSSIDAAILRLNSDKTEKTKETENKETT